MLLDEIEDDFPQRPAPEGILMGRTCHPDEVGLIAMPGQLAVEVFALGEIHHIVRVAVQKQEGRKLAAGGHIGVRADGAKHLMAIVQITAAQVDPRAWSQVQNTSFIGENMAVIRPNNLFAEVVQIYVLK